MSKNKDTQTGDTLKEKKTGVLMGGMSREREISLKTGNSVLNALVKKGYNAVPIDVDRTIAETLLKLGIQVAFIALHGPLGEDGTIQGLLEILGIPYTGSDVPASALAANKGSAKKIFSYHGIPTPRFQVLCAADGDSRSLCERIAIPLPFVLKPPEEGSTIGIRIIREKEEIEDGLKNVFSYGKEVLIEEFIMGRELTVGVLNGEPLPLIEIRAKNGFYDYTAKYTIGATEYIVPPALDEEKTKHVQDIAARAYHALGCKGAARVDCMLGGDSRPYILEINTIPGMTETSLLPMAAKSIGTDFGSLVEKILSGASLYK